MAEREWVVRSGEQLSVLLNIAGEDWQERAHRLLQDYMDRLGPEIRQGHVKLSVQWEAVPGLWDR